MPSLAVPATSAPPPSPQRTVRTRPEAERALFSYIEGFYNPRSRHSANDQLSPAEYERRHTLKNAQALDYAAA
ncbi:hypothetical protein ACWEJ6_48805 [Nonomuraea sp. NPDC004702]